MNQNLKLNSRSASALKSLTLLALSSAWIVGCADNANNNRPQYGLNQQPGFATFPAATPTPAANNVQGQNGQPCPPCANGQNGVNITGNVGLQAGLQAGLTVPGWGINPTWGINGQFGVWNPWMTSFQIPSVQWSGSYNLGLGRNNQDNCKTSRESRCEKYLELELARINKIEAEIRLQTEIVRNRRNRNADVDVDVVINNPDQYPNRQRRSEVDVWKEIEVKYRPRPIGIEGKANLRVNAIFGVAAKVLWDYLPENSGNARFRIGRHYFCEDLGTGRYMCEFTLDADGTVFAYLDKDPVNNKKIPLYLSDRYEFLHISSNADCSMTILIVDSSQGWKENLKSGVHFHTLNGVTRLVVQINPITGAVIPVVTPAPAPATPAAPTNK